MREIAKKCIEIGIIKDLYEQLSENEQKEVLLRKTKDNKATIIKKTAIHNDIEK